MQVVVITLLFLDNHLNDSGRQCCTSFKPLPPITTDAPTCTEFYSLTTIYKPYDSYSVFDSTKIIYEIINETVYMEATLSEVVQYNYLVYFYANGQSLGYGYVIFTFFKFFKA